MRRGGAAKGRGKIVENVRRGNLEMREGRAVVEGMG